MSMIEIEVQGKKEEPVELSAAEKAKLLEELKDLLLPNGSYKGISVEARNAAAEAIMKKLKGEKED